MLSRQIARLSAPILAFLGITALSSMWLLWATQSEEAKEVALQVILVSSPSEAEEISQRLKSGEAGVERLAREHSRDSSASVGGYVGRMRVAGLRSEVQDALKGITPGQATRPFKTPLGYMILKVLPAAKEVEIKGMGGISRFAQAVAGKVQYTTDVSGSYEAVLLFSHFQKVPDDQQDLAGNCQDRLRAIPTGIANLESYLGSLNDQQARRSNTDLMSTHELLGQLWAYQGNVEKASELLQAAYDVASQNDLADIQPELEEKLGIEEMRRGENDNCLHGHHTLSCIFPLGREAWHHRVTGSRNAIQHFLKCLKQNPDDLEVKWLLNLAHMTLGEYPRGVPKQYLIPLSVFESKEDIGRFLDVAPSLGLDVFNMAGGVIVDDFDNDGLLDVVISSFDSCAPLRYFHNNGDGAFTDRTAQAGLSNQLGGLNIIQSDYNNDGWLDIYVMRGGWEQPIRSSLLRNNGDGTFTDVTEEAGLAKVATRTQTAVWADVDNDGRLDLFVGNEFAPSQLFHNNGDGTFTDVAHGAGVDRVSFTKGVVAGDYDNDGYPDIYVSNLGAENVLFHNNRDGTFTDVARQLHVETPIYSFPVWFFDYDNDGWPDLFVSSFTYSLSEVLRSYLGLPVHQETLKLYRNMGDGTFQDVTKKVRLDRVFMPMGANFGDVDNDGYLDFYLGTGGPSYASLVPNVLFRNHEGKYFVDITASSGTGHLQKGHGIAFADLNNDGNEDVFAELGGATQGDKYFSALFRNPGNHGNNWIAIKLVGVKTNRAAIGARIKLTLDSEGHTGRYIYRWVGSGGSFGASPLQQHIGLGNAKEIQALEIWWPTSRSRQVFNDVLANQFIEVKEFQKDYIRLKRPRFALPSMPQMSQTQTMLPR